MLWSRGALSPQRKWLWIGFGFLDEKSWINFIFSPSDVPHSICFLPSFGDDSKSGERNLLKMVVVDSFNAIVSLWWKIANFSILIIGKWWFVTVFPFLLLFPFLFYIIIKELFYFRWWFEVFFQLGKNSILQFLWGFCRGSNQLQGTN